MASAESASACVPLEIAGEGLALLVRLGGKLVALPIGGAPVPVMENWLVQFGAHVFDAKALGRQETPADAREASEVQDDAPAMPQESPEGQEEAPGVNQEASEMPQEAPAAYDSPGSGLVSESEAELVSEPSDDDDDEMYGVDRLVGRVARPDGIYYRVRWLSGETTLEPRRMLLQDIPAVVHAFERRRDASGRQPFKRARPSRWAR